MSERSTQMNLFEGLRRKEECLGRVESNGASFIQSMRQMAIQMSRTRGSVTSDDLRLYAKDNGIEPHHQNAWGAIFRGKKWVMVGRKKSEYPDNHAREIKVWQWSP